jgi:hypothetical protein
MKRNQIRAATSLALILPPSLIPTTASALETAAWGQEASEKSGADAEEGLQILHNGGELGAVDATKTRLKGLLLNGHREREIMNYEL